MEIKIAPSLDCANYANLQRDVEALAAGGADILHIDIMDGHFVTNFTAGPKIVKAVSGLTDMETDVHLQIDEPERYVDMFAEVGADIITFHAESTSRLFQVTSKIKAAGKKASVAINPSTPYEAIETIISRVDMVIVMCVDPGFAGQTFIKEVVPKITKIKNYCNKNDINLDIQVDGNINKKTIPLTKKAGANVFILGTSSIFKQDKDILEQTRYYKQYCQEC